MIPLEAGDPTSVGQGRYRLIGRLGTGGMGVVYFGRSQSGRAVAVKVVRPELSGEPGFRRRFADEVAAARRVGGFHTAPVVDADPEGRPAWLVTAFVPGPTLADVLATVGALPTDTLTVLAAGLAEALEAIHRAGVIHRDLKPANIIVAEDGPRVIDFGIARALDGTALTQTGLQIGTPGFLAPEQLTGGTVTPAVDMFALGVVLSQAAGAAPFGDGPSAARHYRVVHESADLSGVPDELRSLIAACLSKDPRARPTPSGFLSGLTVRDLAGGEWLPAEATALLPKVAPEAAGPPTPATIPAPGRPGGPAPVGPAPSGPASGLPLPGGPAAAAPGTPYPPAGGPTPYAPTVRATPPRGSFGPPSAGFGAAPGPGPASPGGPGAVPPPGTTRPEPQPQPRRRVGLTVAVLVAAAAVAGVLVRHPWSTTSDTDEARANPPASAGHSASSAPASPTEAAFPTAPLLVREDTAPGWPQQCHGQIAIRDAATDNPRRLVSSDSCDILPTWAPDRRSFAFTRTGNGSAAVWVAKADGSDLRRVADIAGGRVSWSPDGTKLAVTHEKYLVNQLFTVNVADGSEQQITTGKTSIQDPAWSPDGKTVALCLEASPGLWQVNLVDLAHPDATPRQITNGTQRALDPVWSPDGKYLAYTYGKPLVGTQGDIHVIGADGTGDHPLAASGDEEMDPVWSPDGKWVAYVRGEISTPAVWAIRADGTGARKLTTGGTPEGHPSWR